MIEQKPKKSNSLSIVFALILGILATSLVFQNNKNIEINLWFWQVKSSFVLILGLVFFLGMLIALLSKVRGRSVYALWQRVQRASIYHQRYASLGLPGRATGAMIFVDEWILHKSWEPARSAHNPWRHVATVQESALADLRACGVGVAF